MLESFQIIKFGQPGRPTQNEVDNRFTGTFFYDVANEIIDNYFNGETKLPEGLEQELETPFPETEDEYMQMTDSQAIELELDVRKNLAIIAARLANAENRRKDREISMNSTEDPREAIKRKNDMMSLFLSRAKVYNDTLAKYGKSEYLELIYGFEFDEKNMMILRANIPGYSRLALHFGSFNAFNYIMQKTNQSLRMGGYKEYPSLNEDLLNMYPYPFGNFGEYYSGLVNDYKGSDESFYIARLKEMLEHAPSTERNIILNDYISLVNADLNDTEIVDIAIKSDLGKFDLEWVNYYLGERDIRTRTFSNAPYRNTQYAWEQLSMAEPEQLSSTLTRMWNNWKNGGGSIPLTNAIFFSDMMLGGVSDEVLQDGTGVKPESLKGAIGTLLTREFINASYEDVSEFIAEITENDLHYNSSMIFADVLTNCVDAKNQAKIMKKIMGCKNIHVLGDRKITNGYEFANRVVNALEMCGTTAKHQATKMNIVSELEKLEKESWDVGEWE